MEPTAYFERRDRQGRLVVLVRYADEAGASEFRLVLPPAGPAFKGGELSPMSKLRGVNWFA